MFDGHFWFGGSYIRWENFTKLCFLPPCQRESSISLCWHFPGKGLFNSMYDLGCRLFWLKSWFIHPGTKAVAIGELGEYRKNAELPVHKCIFLPTQASDGLDATREEINNARRMKDLMTSSSECHQVFQGHLFITITIIIIHCWIPILSICMKKYFLGTKTCFV